MFKKHKKTIFCFKGLNNPISTDIYVNSSELIRKFTKIMKISMAVITPACMILSKFLANLFIYFSTDLGADELELPLPMWWANESPNLKFWRKISFFQFIFLFLGFRLIRKISPVIRLQPLLSTFAYSMWCFLWCACWSSPLLRAWYWFQWPTIWNAVWIRSINTGWAN